MIKKYNWSPSGMHSDNDGLYYKVEDIKALVGTWDKRLIGIRASLKQSTEFLKDKVMLGHLKISDE